MSDAAAEEGLKIEIILLLRNVSHVLSTRSLPMCSLVQSLIRNRRCYADVHWPVGVASRAVLNSGFKNFGMQSIFSRSFTRMIFVISCSNTRLIK